MMRVLAVGLRLLAAIFQLFPIRRRVALLSRQSQTPSADFRLLAARLCEDEPTLTVTISTTESELSGKLQFALHMLRHLWLACTSRVVILDGYNPAVCIPKKRKGIFVIQLWHAAGAIKRFGYQCLDTPAGRTSEQARVACMHMNYDLIIAAGPGAIEAYAQAFGYSQDRVCAFGLPHLEALAKRMSTQDASGSLREQYPWLDNCNINLLYAPTLRRDEDEHWLTSAVDDLALALSETDVNLIVSKHPLTVIDETVLSRHDHVYVLPGKSTTSLLPIADIMVSDYSAISLEAGLIGVPVLFFMPDIERYKTSPGLNIDPVADPLLFGTASAQEIAKVVGDSERISDIRSKFDIFIRRYFDGVDMTQSTIRLAKLIKEHLG